MILGAYLANLLPWMEQVTVLALAGALLPVVFQVRHPRTQLAYCHLILAVCLLLPFLQPWRHPVVVIPTDNVAADDIAASVSAAAPPATDTRIAAAAVDPASPPTTAAGHPFWQTVQGNRLLLLLLAAGVLGRMLWLVAGLWHIRRYRVAATPLYPIPEPIHAASALTHADALFCVSSDVPGPVMLGVFRPVVLLPNSFLSLEEEAQCGIAAHELLHVRRKDWLVTLLEEITGALLWFNPAVWWLLAQTRLAREQLVDAEAVRLTSARESYIHALLAIAKSRPSLDLAPAPLFLRRRHLTQRMHSLLKDASVSGFRLISSYGSIAAILTLAGWLSVASFPLIGRPQFERIAAYVPLPVSSDAPAERPVRAYTIAARPRGDVQEPVTGAIRIPETPAERAAVLSLLEQARQNSDLHIAGTPAFQLDAVFIASGNVDYAGSGALSETWISGQRWRWTANLGNYSQVRIGRGQAGYDERAVSSVPIRVQMLREAIFRPVPFAANQRLRMNTTQWNGKPVTCALLGGDLVSSPGARLWNEQEYCIDKSGLLQVKSPAPGIYVAYDYAGSLQFHGRSIPDRITASVGGITVLDARISIADAGNVDESLVTPTAEMIAAGLGVTLATGQKFFIQAPDGPTDAAQTAIVNAVLGPAGNVLEAEVSDSSDARISQPALDIVKQHPFPPAGTQREVYVNVTFIPVTQ